MLRKIKYVGLVFFLVALVSASNSYCQSRVPKYQKQQKRLYKKALQKGKKGQRRHTNNLKLGGVRKIKVKKARSKRSQFSGGNSKNNPFVEKSLSNSNTSDKVKKNAQDIHKNQMRTQRKAKKRSKTKNLP